MIKQRLQCEGNKKIWYPIKQTVKDPQSLSVLRVQQVIDREIQEIKEKDEVESVIQRECEVGFTLGHSTPIMKNLLANRLRYLLDKEIARQIITGTYDIPDKIDQATKLIFDEIG